MTLVNKVRLSSPSPAFAPLNSLACSLQYVVSGTHFSMTFLLLCIQSSVCSAVVYGCKTAGLISFRDFDMKDAKAWFPISFLLVWVIYTGSKSLVRDRPAD